MIPNINPLETGYTITLILLMFIVVTITFPMSSFSRAVIILSSTTAVIGALHHLSMLPF